MAENEYIQTEVNTEQENSVETKENNILPVKPLILEKVTGTVKWFNVKNGYGFIRRDDENSDIFLHHTGIAKTKQKNKKGSVAEGEKVEFDIVQGQKGQEAANLTGPNGEPVKGFKYNKKSHQKRHKRNIKQKENLRKEQENEQSDKIENFDSKTQNLPQREKRPKQKIKPSDNKDPSQNEQMEEKQTKYNQENRNYPRRQRNYFNQPQDRYFRPRLFYNRDQYSNRGYRQPYRRNYRPPIYDRFDQQRGSDYNTEYRDNYYQPRTRPFPRQRRFYQPETSQNQENNEENN